MSRYIYNNWGKASFVGILVLLAATAGFVGIASGGGDVNTGDVDQSATLLDQANVQWQNGEVAKAALGFLQILDSYPDSPEANAADQGLSEIANAIATGQTTASDVDAFENGLPPVDQLHSFRSKRVVQALLQIKGDGLAKAGDVDGSRAAYQSCIDIGWSLLDEFPDELRLLDVLRINLEAAGGLGKEETQQAVATLEKIAATTDTSTQTYAAHYALADYYVHEGEDRESAERHFDALRVIPDATLKKLDDPAEYPPVKAKILWANGWSAFEMGDYSAATDALDLVSEAYPDGGDTKDTAAYTSVMAKARLQTADPEGAIAQYADYATSGGKYQDMAWVEIGNLYTATGELEEAKTAFANAVEISEQPAIVAAAENRLLEVDRIEQEILIAGEDPLNLSP